MAQRLLAGLRVVDLGSEPSARAARVLGDLGAAVVRVVPPAGDVLRANTARAWNAGKEVVALTADATELDALLDAADVVFDSPGAAGTHQLDPARAPGAVWVSITPFGGDGPRSAWRASDLGVMAASGNMYVTGDPDRAPVRCTEPSGYAHTGGEAAYAALTALWSGIPQRVDVSMQEVVLVANMVAVANYPKTGNRGGRRGANIGRTREIWPALDGYVSFGLRGGKARAREPGDPDQARRRRRHPRRRAHPPGLDHLQPEHREQRRPRRDRERGGRVLLAPHDARALRHRVRDQPDARTGQLAEGDLRVGAARVARLLRTGRRRRALPPLARRRALGRRRSGTRPSRAGRCEAGSRSLPPARARRRREPRRGKACTSWSSVRARRGRSPPDTSPRTVRSCCASSRAPVPTSCARWRWRYPTIHTASKARRCTTG